MKRLKAIAVALALPLAPAGAAAEELDLPQGARLLSERDMILDSYSLPLGPAVDGSVPSRTGEGRVLRRSWQLPGQMTVLQVLAPLRAQIEAAGYEILYQCEARACGGFDFRFAIEVIPAPNMAVDFADYHFLAAEKAGAALTLLVSRSGGAVYVQQVDLFSSGGQDTAPEEDFAGTLAGTGHAELKGLAFAPDTADLQDGGGAALAELAEFLKADPEVSVLLVGHTGAGGTLEGSIALSARRAEAVKERLVAEFGTDGDRIKTAGAGYMAPVASNHSPEGRGANSRIEAVLIPE